MKIKNLYWIFALLFLVSAVNVHGALNDSLSVNFALDEVSGTNVINLQSPYVNGTKTGSPTQNVSGKLGSAYSTWSASNYVNTGFLTPTSGNFSFNIWINWTNTSASEMYVLGDDANPDRGWGLYFYDKNISLGSSVEYGGGWIYSNGLRFNHTGWVMITGTYIYSTQTWKLYIDGVDQGSQLVPNTNVLATSTTNLRMGSRPYTGVEAPYNSAIDQFNWWNGKVLSQSEVTQLYNSSIGLVYPLIPFTAPTFTNSISFVSQVPVNLTAFSLFNATLNLTFNYTNQTTALSNIGLNYSLKGVQSCLEVINGSCLLLNNSLRTAVINSSVVSSSYTVASWLLNENQIYPYTAIVNSTFLNQPHLNHTMTGNNDFLAYKLLNVSNITRSNILEIDLVDTAISRIYLCNSSISLIGAMDPLTDLNCQEIGSINSNVFNHTHGLYSGHNLVPFSVVNGSIGGSGIKVTSTMWILARGNGVGVVNVGYVPVGSLSTSVYSTANGGNTWTDQSASYSIDSHLHQYNGSETLTYYAFGTFNATVNVSSNVSELIDVPPLNPNPVIITIPFNTVQSTRYLNISYINATANTIGASISYYNISLLNSNQSFNRTIVENNSVNTSYLYDLYSKNLSLGVYFVQVTAFDTLGKFASDEESFNLTRNALLNVTAYDISTNASISNLSINVTDLSNNFSQLWNSSGSLIGVDIIKGRNYFISFDVNNYAYLNVTYSANTSSFQKLNQSLYKTNSVSINVYDETSLALITNVTAGGQINITFISDAGSFTVNTTTGIVFVSNISAGFYEVKFNAPLYAQRSYFLTVTNRSTQTLNAYLSQSTINLLLTYANKETGELIDGVGVNVYKIINGSWTAVATGFTDITGRLQVSVSTNINYRFSSSIVGYDDKTFNLNPVIFTAYTILLTKQQTSSSQLDFANINVYVINTTFKTNGSNYFSWQISAPNGNLEQYAYSLSTRCKNISSFSGVNAFGGINVDVFNLSCATGQDHVTLKYNYTLTGGEIRSFTYTYSILGNATQGSFMQNKDETYGMGMFERILIVVLITIVMAGLITKFSNIVAGLSAGLLIMSYLSYIGFIEWWLIAPTLLVGFVLITSWSTSR